MFRLYLCYKLFKCSNQQSLILSQFQRSHVWKKGVSGWDRYKNQWRVRDTSAPDASGLFGMWLCNFNLYLYLDMTLSSKF